MTYVEITADFNDPRLAIEIDRHAEQYGGHRSERTTRKKNTVAWEFGDVTSARQFAGVLNMGGAITGIAYSGDTGQPA